MRLNKIAILVILAAVAGVGYVFFGASEDDGIPEDIAYGNGRIEAAQVDISTRIAGRVEEVLVREGDMVLPGQAVAKIDSTQLRAQLSRALADIARAESQVGAASASVAQAKAQLILAEQELKRTSKLVKQGHTSRETYDTRMSQRQVAKANLEAAQAMKIAEERGVDAARAGAQEIRTQIDDCILLAPAVGRVLYRLAEPGEVLGSGGRVMTLLNLSDVYMEIFLPSAQAHRVSIGSDARVKLDIFDFAVPATVSFISPQSQFTPKQVETQDEREKLMFRVKVRVPEDLVKQNIERVKTGMRGLAYVRLDVENQSDWPLFLEKRPPGMTSPKATE